MHWCRTQGQQASSHFSKENPGSHKIPKARYASPHCTLAASLRAIKFYCFKVKGLSIGLWSGCQQKKIFGRSQGLPLHGNQDWQLEVRARLYMIKVQLIWRCNSFISLWRPQGWQTKHMAMPSKIQLMSVYLFVPNVSLQACNALMAG